MRSIGRTRVLGAAPPMRWESGTTRDRLYRPARVAVLAHWSDRPEVSLSTLELVRQLSAEGYDVIVSSAAECRGPLQWPAQAPARTTVYRRANLGYDFGSWSQALAHLPGIRDADVVLLLNDSLIGPFRPLSSILTSLESDPRPVWGLVSTTQDRPHLQSHFIAYKQGVLNHPKLRRFWDGISEEPTKRTLIRRYEIGLSVVMRRYGIPYGVGYPYERVVTAGGNPTSQGWRRLLLWGFPFVKRELVLRPPPEVPDAADIPSVIMDMFGEDVRKWV